MRLKCVVDGGDPAPNVTWWIRRRRKGGGRELIDETFSVHDSETRNHLELKKLSRADFRRTVSCRADNSGMPGGAKEASVWIDMRREWRHCM